MNANDQNEQNKNSNPTTYPGTGIPVGSDPISLESIKKNEIDPRIDIDDRSNVSSIQRYKFVTNKIIQSLKLEAKANKDLWVEANTANIELRRQNEYLDEQVGALSQAQVQKLELEAHSKRRDFVVNQSKENLKKMLSEDWDYQLKNGKI